MSRKKYTLGHEPFVPSVDAAVKSTKEQNALQQFKSRIKDKLKPEYDDHYLVKWLRARNLDVDKAELMFRNSIAFKEKMGLDKLLKEYSPPEVLQNYFPGGFCGFDKEGSPILVELIGNLDMKGIIHSARKVDIEKTQLLKGESIMTELKKQSDRLGRHIDGMTVILDMDGVGSWLLWGPGLQMYIHIGKILQDNYPEIVKRSYIVNAPRVFPIMWKIVQPLLTEEMKKKVCILGGDYKKELLKNIAPDEFPVFLGGSQTDEDGNQLCLNKICQGGKIPESYYLKELLNTDNLHTKAIQPGEKLKLKYLIEKKGSVLRYEFKTDDYDVGFGVYYTDDGDSKPVVLLEDERVNSHMIPEDGAVTCDMPGTYVVCFDNSYSWTRGKTIHYNIDIILSDEAVVADLDKLTQGGSWEKVAEKTETTYL